MWALVPHRRHVRLATVATAIALVLAGTAAAAFVGLPADGSQVNNDPANGIDPNQDAGVSDVQGGTVVAGNLQVPWAAFEQKSGSSQQIFVRAFKGGAWVTQGFPASLNIDPTVEAEAPSIDFAGAGRTVPWVAWYEPNANLGSKKQIFASRFSAAVECLAAVGPGRARRPQPAVAQHQHHPRRRESRRRRRSRRRGQRSRSLGGLAGARRRRCRQEPDLRLAWRQAGGCGTACVGKPATATLNINGFCWLQVGLDRLNPTTGASSAAGDPTLSIDPTRDAIEPDDAFTGPSDTVPWVVWYEQSAGLNGISNELVFAAKAVSRRSRGRRLPLGRGRQWHGRADQRARHPGRQPVRLVRRECGPERACSLNKDATVDAEDPRVAAGTLTPGGATVPWVAWSETIGAGRHGIFVSRLVGGDHFELFNSGPADLEHAERCDAARHRVLRQHAVHHLAGERRRPVPHLQRPLRGWRGHSGLQARHANGHRHASGTADLRPPVSSTCTANPTNADGSHLSGWRCRHAVLPVRRRHRSERSTCSPRRTRRVTSRPARPRP